MKTTCKEGNLLGMLVFSSKETLGNNLHPILGKLKDFLSSRGLVRGLMSGGKERFLLGRILARHNDTDGLWQVLLEEKLSMLFISLQKHGRVRMDLDPPEFHQSLGSKEMGSCWIIQRLLTIPMNLAGDYNGFHSVRVIQILLRVRRWEMAITGRTKTRGPAKIPKAGMPRRKLSETAL